MTINSCLRRARRLHGNRIAIHHEDRQITYREFSEIAENSARKLVGLGAAKGDRVAVLMLNSPEYLDLYYSTALAGTIIVPLNTRWHINEIIFTLTDSGSKILFVDQRHVGLVEQIRAGVPCLEHIVFIGDWAAVEPSGVLPEGEPDENEVVGLFYTSGTTGGPKGAMLTHRNLYTQAIHSMIAPLGISKDWKFLHSAPMFHLADAGAINALTLAGATHCFIPSFDAEEVLRAIERYRINNLVLVPTMINMVVNHPNFGRYDLSSVKRVLYGASPMPLPLLRQAIDQLRCEFVQGYGMTEVSAIATVLGPEDHQFEDSDRQFAPVKSGGKAAVYVEIRVVDHNDNDVPVGAVGEVIVRGPNVMKGYWNRPEITAEVLRGGWMHTGDLGTLDDEGFLYILDRKKDMIKSGDENVFSPEVESVICGHPAILEAAVIGVPHERWGETIRAVVVRRPGAELAEAELIAWCRERMTHFKCPTSVAFAETLPKGGTGKVQKNVLRERFGGELGWAADERR
ncbi:MAG TPA: long-chain fatty acid--CoA ligase [Bryobacteraceae bacterium]|nr:long-chain fatty acid--CoA ligase [Bryobacteraceae bacterium]